MLNPFLHLRPVCHDLLQLCSEDFTAGLQALLQLLQRCCQRVALLRCCRLNLVIRCIGLLLQGLCEHRTDLRDHLWKYGSRQLRSNSLSLLFALFCLGCIIAGSKKTGYENRKQYARNHGNRPRQFGHKSR